MAEEQRLDYIPVTFTLGAAGVDSATRLGTGQKWLNGPLTLVGPRAEIQGPGGAYLRSTGTASSDALIELRLTGAVNDSKIQLTEQTLTLEGGSAVEITANTTGTVTVHSPTVISSNTDPSSPTSTAHAFQVGSPSGTSGHYQLKIGPRQIMATEADSLTSSLNINDDGGAILGRGYQIAPIRNVGTAIVGTAAASTSMTAEYYIQAGTNSVSFTNSVGTLTFPTAFTNGVLSWTGNVLAGAAGDHSLAYMSSTTSVSQIRLMLYVSDALFTGSATISWQAIGW